MTPQRRKSARQLAAEARRATAEKEVSQTIRDVYRKLAGALHPDRPSDELSEERKTALMQRVNQAYDSRNLLELLDIGAEEGRVRPLRQWMLHDGTRTEPLGVPAGATSAPHAGARAT